MNNVLLRLQVATLADEFVRAETSHCEGVRTEAKASASVRTAQMAPAYVRAAQAIASQRILREGLNLQ